MSKLRVFISSVQKELENERLAVLSLISTDQFLQAHCEPVLYEFEPASPEKAVEECLALLNKCDICLTIIWKEAPAKNGGLAGQGRRTHQPEMRKTLRRYQGHRQQGLRPTD